MLTGRGRTRGRRLINPSVLLPHLRPLTISSPQQGEEEKETRSIQEKEESTEELAKSILVKEIQEIENSGNGCIISLSLNFLSKDSDLVFFVETMWESCMRSDKMCELFSKCVKFLTLHKIHGTELKKRIFIKLQTVTQELPPLTDVSGLSSKEKLKLYNYCNIMGQLYFRFRPFIGKEDRYNVLAPAALKCLRYLFHLGGKREIPSLIQQLNLNYKALNEGMPLEMIQFCQEVHTCMIARGTSGEDRVWMLCVIDHLTLGLPTQQLPDHIKTFFQIRFRKDEWEKMAVKSPVEIMARIPEEINKNDLQMFDIDLDEYNGARLVPL